MLDPLYPSLLLVFCCVNHCRLSVRGCGRGNTNKWITHRLDRQAHFLVRWSIVSLASLFSASACLAASARTAASRATRAAWASLQQANNPTVHSPVVQSNQHQHTSRARHSQHNHTLFYNLFTVPTCVYCLWCVQFKTSTFQTYSQSSHVQSSNMCIYCLWCIQIKKSTFRTYIHKVCKYKVPTCCDVISQNVAYSVSVKLFMCL